MPQLTSRDKERMKAFKIYRGTLFTYYNQKIIAATLRGLIPYGTGPSPFDLLKDGFVEKFVTDLEAQHGEIVIDMVKPERPVYKDTPNVSKTIHQPDIITCDPISYETATEAVNVLSITTAHFVAVAEIIEHCENSQENESPSDYIPDAVRKQDIHDVRNELFGTVESVNVVEFNEKEVKQSGEEKRSIRPMANFYKRRDNKTGRDDRPDQESRFDTVFNMGHIVRKRFKSTYKKANRSFRGFKVTPDLNKLNLEELQIIGNFSNCSTKLKLKMLYPDLRFSSEPCEKKYCYTAININKYEGLAKTMKRQHGDSLGDVYRFQRCVCGTLYYQLAMENILQHDYAAVLLRASKYAYCKFKNKLHIDVSVLAFASELPDDIT